MGSFGLEVVCWGIAGGMREGKGGRGTDGL